VKASELQSNVRTVVIVAVLALAAIKGRELWYAGKLPFTRNPSYASASVVLLSTSWCPWCRTAREMFRSEGIPYTEYDVETTPKGRELYRRYDGSGVPLIIVNGVVIRGFNKVAIYQALRRSETPRRGDP